MIMNTLHPSEYIKAAFIDPEITSVNDLATRLGVSAFSVEGILCDSKAIDANLAVSFEYVLGRSADSWLAMQVNLDLAQARDNFDESALTPL
jgi:addiction module HigA family antidote